ncbi:MAG: SRPBCC family protein [Bacteroidota bacterium]
MKRFITTEHEINAPIEKVWAKIAQGDGCENWLTIIQDSRLEEGNRRVCTMHEGGDLEETILKSDQNKTFMYRIDKQEAFPASDIVGLIRLEEIEQGRTKLLWDVEMFVEADEAFSQIKAMTEQVYADSATKLESIA